MITATLKDAKARLNELVEKAVQGEDVVLMKGSKHVAALVPITEADLELVPRLTDAQAGRLWEMVDRESKEGKLKELAAAEDLLE
jgi:prevent-host-death family protein